MAIDQYGQIIRRAPRPIPINTAPYHTPSPSAGPTFTYEELSLWDRFDNFIRRIGNWFAEYAETITGLIALAICAIGAIMFVSWLFSLGWVWGIVAGLLLGGVVCYAVMVVAGIFVFFGNIALGIVRYVFYNGWTFLIAIALILGLTMFGGCSHQTYRQSRPPETLQASYATTTYVCTANSSLKVRRYPTMTASQIGSLARGQEVEVIDISDGFAHVKLNGQDGYASTKYLRKKY